MRGLRIHLIHAIINDPEMSLADMSIPILLHLPRELLSVEIIFPFFGHFYCKYYCKYAYMGGGNRFDETQRIFLYSHCRSSHQKATVLLRATCGMHCPNSKNN